LCLMASLLVIPASATSVTTVTFDGLSAVAAMIAGTGVTINAVENFPVFNTLVSSVFDHLTALDYINAAGTISALVAPIPGTSVETNYEDWAKNAIIIEFPVPPDPEKPEDPTDPSTPEEPTTPAPIKIPGLPLYIPSYPQTDVPSLPSQEEVQNPQSIEVPDPDPGVSVDPTLDIDPTLAPDNPADSAGEPPPLIEMTMNLKKRFPVLYVPSIFAFHFRGFSERDT
ncbi:MAG: hypothetical protein Q4B72_13990, partial [Lachnospiraceae bacterium]|nr:hypothetical protein [Lachnospiraceae bacterium]